MAKKIQKKKIQVNTKVVFDDEGEGSGNCVPSFMRYRVVLFQI